MQSQQSRKTSYRWALGIALIVSLCLGMLFVFIYNSYRDELLQRERRNLSQELATVVNRLTISINQRLLLLDGLWAFTATSLHDESNFDDEFTSFMQKLYTNTRGIINFSVARDGIQTIVYPQQGNEDIVGHDLINDERESVRADVQRAIETRRTILSGPYVLRQGGLGLVARKAVFHDTGFWGLVIMVLDMDNLFFEGHFEYFDGHLAIRDDQQQVFWGDPTIFDESFISNTVSLPDGYWTVATALQGEKNAVIQVELLKFQLGGGLIITLLTAIVYFGIHRQIHLTNQISRQADEVFDANQELRESEQRYLNLYDNAPDMYFTLDAKTRTIMQCNQTFANVMGYTQAELVGQPIYLFYEETSKLIAEAYQKKFVEQGNLDGIELTYRRKDGSTFVASVNALAMRDETGQVKYSHTTLRDVTKDRDMSRALYFAAERRWGDDRRAFFDELVCYTADLLDMTSVFIGELVDDTHVKTVAFCVQNKVIENFTYELSGTPCESVINKAAFCHIDNLPQRFPQYHVPHSRVAHSHDFKLISYAGIPLNDSSGQVIGVLAAQDRYPLHKVELIETVLQIMAGRVAHELEQQRVDSVLRESEQRFRKIFESGPIGIYLIDSDFTFLRVNQMFCELLGYEIDELTGRNLLDFIHPDEWDTDVSRQLWMGNIEGFYNERRYLRKDGTWLWTGLRTSIVHNGSGKVLYGLGMVENIAERKEAEDTLKFYGEFQNLVTALATKFIDLPMKHLEDEFEKSLAAIGRFIGALRLHLHEFKQDTFTIHSNYRWYDSQRLTGNLTSKVLLDWLTEHLKDGDIFRLANIDDLPPENQTERDILEKNGTKSFLAIRYRDESHFIGVMTMHFGETATIPSDSIIGLVQIVGNVFFNVLKRKRATEEIDRLNQDLELRILDRTAELAEEKQRTDTILQSIADAVVFTDRDARILYVNPAWERLTGYSLQEVMGKTPGILSDGQTEKIIYERMWASILAGNIWSGVIFNKRKNGVTFDAELTIAPVMDDTGEVQYFVGVQRDVTETRKLAQMKERFIADAAHDLGNPVAILQTSLYLLKKDPSQLARRLAQIERETNRLTALVRDMLTVSRLDRGMLETDLERFDLAEVILDIVDSQYELAKQKGIKLTFEAQDNLPFVLGDQKQLERVIVNLIANALNYTQRDGQITINLVSEGPEIVLNIADTGIGIPAQDLPHIFDRFYRSDLARQTSEGTGLGLSIVKEIVNLYDGYISVDSVEGEGTIFTIRLPML